MVGKEIRKDTFTFLIGGKAGGGIKSAASLSSSLFASMGRSVFQNNDYPSLIRGGHNFSVITSRATGKVSSHHSQSDLIVSLDQRSHDLHKGQLAEEGLEVFNSDAVRETDKSEAVGIPMTAEAKKYPDPERRLGIGAAAILASALGLDVDFFMSELEKAFPRQYAHNRDYALAILERARQAGVAGRFSMKKAAGAKRPVIAGSEAIGLGMAAAGLDMYFAYPMTPASPILHFLAANEQRLGLVVLHPENELAVANMAIGAAAVGARVALGSSGGGFALMQEAFSLAAMTETPLLCILASRPGPSTGVPTYTAQSDLMFALHQGHGDFARLVASPGSVEEAFYLSAELLNLAWRFQTPAILLTEKHLSEASMTVEIDPDRAAWPEPRLFAEEAGEYRRYRDTPDGVSPLLFPPSSELIKWSSYEHDEKGITTEAPELVVKMQEKRLRKQSAIVDHLRDRKTVNVYGQGDLTVFCYGSTTMSVLEALYMEGIEARVVQPVYLRPLPVWELDKYLTDRAVVVEQSASGQFATLLQDKLRLGNVHSVRRYDGRPFDPVELAQAIKGVT